MNKKAITIWIDESTEIFLDKEEYTLIGYLITDSDSGEYRFLDKLKQARKEIPQCWNTIHGCEIGSDDETKIELVRRWINIFKTCEDVFFHAFLYRKNETYISKNETYEHYFAKQSVFSLANKMKKTGMPIQTIFSNIGTLTVFFDGRRAHSASIISNGLEKNEIIERFNKLESVYQEKISEQIKSVSRRQDLDLTVRFSFLSSECFDALQLTDILLHMLRHKIENKQSIFAAIFDLYFLNDLEENVRALGFEKIYKEDMKFNYFRSYK